MHTTAALATYDSQPGAMAAGKPLLAIRDVGIAFGGIVALEAVSYDLAVGQILGLIGPNGAGKTTLFNCVTRLYTPNRGTILFEQRDILDKSADRIPFLGIARTFQNLALFRTMTVFDNVRVGGQAPDRDGQSSDGKKCGHAPKSDQGRHCP